MRKTLILLVLTIHFSPVFTQEQDTPKKTNKGSIYAFWGWNRSWYTNSDIHFTGDDYDFFLNDVHAQDRQTPFGFDPYFSFTRITIPQTNLRIGYFITEHLDISVAVDHMKYIMPNNQTVEITGKIDDNSIYQNDYDHDNIFLAKSFIFFEHSDGLNYLNVEITRNDDLLKLMKVNMNPEKLEISSLVGFGGGPLMPRSNVTLWGNARHDEFHIAGYGFAGKIGINAKFYKYFFLRGEFKGGFIDMPDIRTSPDVSDKASQHFFFTEVLFAFGFTINPFNH